jgi:hypothetical protein
MGRTHTVSLKPRDAWVEVLSNAFVRSPEEVEAAMEATEKLIRIEIREAMAAGRERCRKAHMEGFYAHSGE